MEIWVILELGNSLETMPSPIAFAFCDYWVSVLDSETRLCSIKVHRNQPPSFPPSSFAVFDIFTPWPLEPMSCKRDFADLKVSKSDRICHIPRTLAILARLVALYNILKYTSKHNGTQSLMSWQIGSCKWMQGLWKMVNKKTCNGEIDPKSNSL